MSFLEAITRKKKHLKPCQTILTTPQGEQFVETRSRYGFTMTSTDTLTSGFVIDVEPDMEVAQILPYLFLSSQDAANDPETLRAHKITRVLSLGVDVCQLNKVEGVLYKFIDFLDLPECNICDIFDECFEFIEGSGRDKVLVHCNAGISRSASVVIGYLMKKKRMSFQKAFSFVKSKRNVVKPNDGFIRNLLLFEKLIDVK